MSDGGNPTRARCPEKRADGDSREAGGPPHLNRESPAPLERAYRNLKKGRNQLTTSTAETLVGAEAEPILRIAPVTSRRNMMIARGARRNSGSPTTSLSACSAGTWTITTHRRRRRRERAQEHNRRWHPFHPALCRRVSFAAGNTHICSTAPAAKQSRIRGNLPVLRRRHGAVIAIRQAQGSA